MRPDSSGLDEKRIFTEFQVKGHPSLGRATRLARSMSAKGTGSAMVKIADSGNPSPDCVGSIDGRASSLCCAFGCLLPCTLLRYSVYDSCWLLSVCVFYYRT